MVVWMHMAWGRGRWLDGYGVCGRGEDLWCGKGFVNGRGMVNGGKGGGL